MVTVHYILYVDGGSAFFKYSGISSVPNVSRMRRRTQILLSTLNEMNKL